MIVTGFTSQLRNDAERKCGGRSLAWLVEVRKSQCGSWHELLRYYPRASRTEDNEAHFPLTADGTGIRAVVIIKPGVLRISAAPAERRHVPLSHPHIQPKLHESTTKL